MEVEWAGDTDRLPTQPLLVVAAAADSVEAAAVAEVDTIAPKPTLLAM